ncbi:hypothetical protein RRG08_024231 [Elysia crispata]|uniref:Uncharacterized protein n=1 Tax=Elysia crispata TaxID=231223 RepID=A0AAE1D2T1_9GAST|nr:hypothetical protein RRG08_024231 [Elysia crispata]
MKVKALNRRLEPGVRTLVSGSVVSGWPAGKHAKNFCMSFDGININIDPTSLMKRPNFVSLASSLASGSDSSQRDLAKILPTSTSLDFISFPQSLTTVLIPVRRLLQPSTNLVCCHSDEGGKILCLALTTSTRVEQDLSSSEFERRIASSTRYVAPNLMAILKVKVLSLLGG